MKIVHVVNSMEMGGAESLVAQLARLQRQQGHEVSVLARGRVGTLGERLLEERFCVESVGEGNPLAKLPAFLAAFRRLAPEVVHCHNAAPTIGAAMAARIARPGCVVVSTRHSLVEPPYNMAEERMYGVAARFCDWIVGICEVTCENLRGAPMARRDRIVRVYNGVAAMQPVDNGVAAMPVSAGDRVGEPGVTLLFVGRLAVVKDLETMVRAFAAARVELPELRLWIVGGGPERGRLEAIAAELGVLGTSEGGEGVRFWGERHDVARFFAAADAFAMSSVSEGLPMSLLQAMSVAVPALVTDVGGMAEVVRETDCGLRVPVGDAAAMARAMVRLGTDAGLRDRLGRNGRAAWEAGFTLERMSEAYLRLYESRPAR